MPTRTSASFETSLAFARELVRQERASPKLNPDCHSILLEHGHRTPHAVAFMHGITSSPVQFHDLGLLFFGQGYNVFIPRMPRHGHANRLTPDHARLTRAEFKAYAGRTVDIARGLGEKLTVAGLSVSGVLAAWLAQTRPEMDLAALIAPAFAPHGVPLELMPGLARLARIVPNAFVWWDLRRRASTGPMCSYPRFSTRALAESFLLGLDVYQAARRQRPAARRIVAITNPHDMAVNNAATQAVLRRWRAHATADVGEYAFAADLGPLHDVIGPYQENARVDYVYPILLDLLGRT